MHALVRESAVTARVTTLKGDDAGAYYVEGPGRYYLDGDEPPGRWLGRHPFGIVERDVVLVDLDREDELVGASHAEIIARVRAELER